MNSIMIKIILLSLVFTAIIFCYGQKQEGGNFIKTVVKLPQPRFRSDVSIEETLLKRRSHRSFANIQIELSDISQLMWAAQGSTDPRGLRTAPSAGALYPLELYLIATDVKNLKKGVYKYNTRNHELILLSEEDIRIKLAEAALDQDVIRNAPAIIVISAIYDRVTGKYGTRGIRYTDMEAGHTAQNIYLQATSLNLGTVAIGAFDDDNIVKVTGMSKNEKPLYIMPIGKMK